MPAEAAYRRVLAAAPSSYAALVGLAAVLKRRERLQEALGYFQQAAACNDAQVEAYLEAGVVSALAGSIDNASAWLSRAAERFPASYQPYYFLGAMQATAGKTDTAVQLLGRAIALAPKASETHSTLIQVLRGANRPAEAEKATRNWAAAAPGDPAALATLTHILLEQERLDEAESSARAALAISPQNTDLFILHARILVLQGNIECALTELEQARKLAPTYPDIHVHQGNALKIAGRMSEAITALRQAIALDPRNDTAFFELSEIVEFKPDDPLLAQMERRANDLQRAGRAVSSRLGFALGKAHDDLGNFDRAFEHFYRANETERRAAAYDIAPLLSQIDDLIRTSPQGSMHPAAPNEHADRPTPIFIVGMPRSGSTLIEQVLAAHPNVAVLGERALLRHALQDVLSQKASTTDLVEGIQSLMRNGGFPAVAERYTGLTAPYIHGGTHLVDKQLANSLLVGLIYASFPKAKIVYCSRDPVDTCFSCYTKFFSPRVPYSTDLDALGRFYRHHAKLMAHWQSVLPPGTILEMRYEDVVADLETQARRLLAHCDLTWDDRCLAFHSGKGPVNTASVAQVRRPLYEHAVDRWKRYEAHLAPLIAALGDITL